MAGDSQAAMKWNYISVAKTTDEADEFPESTQPPTRWREKRSARLVDGIEDGAPL